MENEKTKLLRSLIPGHADLLALEYISEGSVLSDGGNRYSHLPPFHRIRLALHPAERSNIRLEIWLPDEWNGRFAATGSGGIGGFLTYDLIAMMMREGFACANTDIGTSGGLTSGFENDEVKADYGYRATHLMAVYGKQIVTGFYGKAPSYSYFRGSSTGGMQAYSEAQRYPEDFDGIYAEVPSILNAAFHTNYMWAWRHLHKDNGSSLFTAEERARITSLAAAFFRARGDGEEGDCFVSYPYYGKETIGDFMRYLRDNADGFTEEQLAGLQAVYEGPFDEKRGLRISCGMPIGSEWDWGSYSGENCPGIYPFVWAFGPSFDPRKFDFSDDFQVFNGKMSRYINATSPDLSAFRARGGKLLASAGTADPVVLYPELNIYYEKVVSCLGGLGNAMDCFRYYVLPGRGHGYGYGADSISTPGKNGWGAFDALVRWVENGEAPYRLDAVSHEDAGWKGKKAFARAIYPYGSPEFPFMPHPGTYSDGIISQG